MSTHVYWKLKLFSLHLSFRWTFEQSKSWAVGTASTPSRFFCRSWDVSCSRRKMSSWHNLQREASSKRQQHQIEFEDHSQQQQQQQQQNNKVEIDWVKIKLRQNVSYLERRKQDHFNPTRFAFPLSSLFNPCQNPPYLFFNNIIPK